MTAVVGPWTDPSADGAGEMSPARCWALLSGEQVGRIVYTDAALPAVRPAPYACSGDSVVVRLDDARLAAALDGAVVAFEVDRLDPAVRNRWSVVLTGVAAAVPAQRPDAETPDAPAGPPLVRIRPGLLTGRWVDSAPAS